ncbi:MAG TPA: hypothetical protein VG388_15570 [Solirubrobacteraceae bacterium]|nr:hypothetical protein [Solirubrobacteraceae bacterium]
MGAGAVSIEDLERWELAGAHWRVVDITSDHVVVDLCACTGEPVERVESGEPAVISYVRMRDQDPLDPLSGEHGP